jgi:hypothetical protein
MGTDAPKKSSYMKSLKNFPMRFRTSKDSTGMPVKSVDPQQLSNNQNPDEELSTETDTVAPTSKAEGAAGINPKLVVRATMSTAPLDTEFNDPSTAPTMVYMTSYGGNMTYPLTRTETNVGRKDDNHIILTDATISKFHSIIYRKPEG